MALRSLAAYAGAWDGRSWSWTTRAASLRRLSTIHGAELWALQMAAMHALPGTAYRNDCLALLQVFSRGRAWATASGRYYARIWNVIFSSLDDAEERSGLGVNASAFASRRRGPPAVERWVLSHCDGPLGER